MKKNLFFISVAVLALSSCNNDTVVDENLSANQPKEITIQAIATPTTRAAVNGTDFPTGVNIKVAAYDATAGANYFEPTTFENVASTTNWSGNRYWPFTAATINFLAYSEFSNVTPTWNATNPASAVSLALADNKTAQNDLMYACGTGTVTQASGSNTLGFPDGNKVAMTFKHAQAWIQFTVKAGDATSATKISVDSITLNSVACAGTFEVAHSNWDKTKAQRDADATLAGSVTGSWGNYSSSNIGAVKAAGYSGFSTTKAEFGNLLVVPAQGIASFTIHYTLDGNTYDYTYTPAVTTLAQATKYIYDITLTVHEIVIAPTVADWSASTAVAVGI